MKPERLLQLLKNEWERVTLACICIVGVTLSSFGGLRFLELFQKDQSPVANTVKVQESYAPDAFAFVKRDDAVGIAQNHPLTVRPPASWLASRKREQALKARNAARIAAQQRLDKQRIWQQKKKELQKRRQAQGGKAAGADKNGPTKPNPPIQHYIVFKGFFKHPQAGQLVYLGLQSVQGDVTRRDKPVFVKKDEEFGEYKIDDVDEDVVILKDKKGRRFEVVRGEPYHYKTDQNPAEMLQPNEEPQREGGAGNPSKKPRTAKTKGGAKRGGGASQLQNLLKSGKMDISNKDIQKLLKGGNVSTKQIQDLLKKFGGKKKKK